MLKSTYEIILMWHKEIAFEEKRISMSNCMDKGVKFPNRSQCVEWTLFSLNISVHISYLSLATMPPRCVSI